ncbi:MAG: hypothetical protein KAF40_01440 [Flavihumibacter sp.]|nr:hypothetical protein [Flavihumibacter sp.]
MTTDQRLQRIERMLSELLQEKRKTTWVNGQVITELTGWDKEKMRSMRDQGVLKFKRSGVKTIKYALESVPEQFIIKSAIK